MDGSLMGEDFTLAITACWVISALCLGAIAAWAVARYRKVSGNDHD
ncbi:hypothetical protein FF098_016160 [Parvularcula flava]|uniref:Uncharacterized protein n=1 Tax=Aquisalinus luteolus TaxID=1566827 RepID=A0A8J3EVW6_9PROT|nr:hypothetical protein [Aquisalinus luteolus]NHK29447.1 hypothetical protein [Aquisalinus luteolus]GGI01919.1 hypothetical protein GCM10011355_33690 [Aquisalinus luteolus]